MKKINEMKIHRTDPEYAWGVCNTPREWKRQGETITGECGNTVKFGADGSEGACPACGMMYRCNGDTARPSGLIVHDDDDRTDPGTAIDVPDCEPLQHRIRPRRTR